VARRTIDQQIAQLEARRSELEAAISEQERYKSLKAPGEGGSETQFTNADKLYSELATVENKLATYYNYKEN